MDRIEGEDGAELARKIFKEDGVGTYTIKPYYNKLGGGKDRLRRIARIIIAILFVAGIVIGTTSLETIAFYYVILSLLSGISALAVLPRTFKPQEIVDELMGRGLKITGWSSYNTRLPLQAVTGDNIQVLIAYSGKLRIIVTDASKYIPLPIGSKVKTKISVEGEGIRGGKKQKSYSPLRRVELTIPSLKSPLLFTKYRGDAVVTDVHIRHLKSTDYAEKIIYSVNEYRRLLKPISF